MLMDNKTISSPQASWTYPDHKERAITIFPRFVQHLLTRLHLIILPLNPFISSNHRSLGI